MVLGDELVGRMVEQSLLADVADYYDRLSVDMLAAVDSGRRYETSTRDHRKGAPSSLVRPSRPRSWGRSKTSPNRKPVSRPLWFGHPSWAPTWRLCSRPLWEHAGALTLASEEDIAAIDGIGPKIAGGSQEFLSVPKSGRDERLRRARYLSSGGLWPAAPKTPEPLWS